jgi:hypothetical protein
MPSPFPGMDPYLEGSTWMNFHGQLCAEIARQLGPKLRPRYLARLTERFFTGTSVDSVEIRDRIERRLVTSIEVLSPSNKRGEGRQEYLAKRRRVLHSTSHLIEIDLLRTGQRVPMKDLLPKAPCYVYVGRFEIRPDTDVWPISLDRSLPQVPVPLLAKDPDVTLDLQLAFTSVYDLSDYDLEIDYTQRPDTPLSPEESDWLDSRLRTVGLRP